MVGGKKDTPKQKKLKGTIQTLQHKFRTKLQPRKKGESERAHRTRTGKTMGEFASKRGSKSMMTGKVNTSALGKNMTSRIKATLKRAVKARKK